MCTCAVFRGLAMKTYFQLQLLNFTTERGRTEVVPVFHTTLSLICPVIIGPPQASIVLAFVPVVFSIISHSVTTKKKAKKAKSSSLVSALDNGNSQDSLPHQSVHCVCQSSEDVGHMVECEVCSRWSHCPCVGISHELAASYPFVCPLCVRLLFSRLTVVESEVAILLAELTPLEPLIQISKSN